MKSSRRTIRKRATTKQLDALARAVVFKRDGEQCVRCGKTDRLQWCHVYSRRYHSLRWDTDNSFVGCAGCHLWWHHQPVAAAQWWASTYPERDKRCRLIMQTVRKIDKEAVRQYLEAELA